ncbi:MAG TPA: hypothetical protein VMH37_15025, partial [Candidatus Binataceae bacterium]|nr:hypothetical protein [Candidatus Binataceae bacterium]
YPLLNVDDAFKKECDAVCQNWAVKDLDCPTDGCYGFSVTLPAGFDPTPTTNPLPSPSCFPNDKDWAMPFGNPNGFDAAKADVAGACYYSSLPSSDFCPSQGSAKGNSNERQIGIEGGESGHEADAEKMLAVRLAQPLAHSRARNGIGLTGNDLVDQQ